MTLSRRLALILVVNLFMTISVAVCGLWALRTQKEFSTQVSLMRDALENHAAADMMHDALRGDIYAALLSTYGQPGIPPVTVIENDLREHVATFRKKIEETEAFEMSPEISEALAQTKPKLNDYIASAEQLIKMVVGKDKQASTYLPSFASSFEELEAKMESLGELISNTASDVQEKGNAEALWLQYFDILLLIVAVIVGAGASIALSRAISRKLLKVMVGLAQGAHRTHQSSEQLETLSQDLAQSATRQTTTVQETANSVAEMSNMIGQTVESAKQSLGFARQVSEQAEEGGQTMESMVKSMSSIHRANARLQDMAAIIQEISSKTTIINDIVFKTQLLAFNASIEAARAGQHGRGFAVVAEEVGNLAEMSGNAAKEIQMLLDQSQKQVHEIVTDTERRVTEGQSVSEKAMNTFLKISKDIVSISTQMQSITEAAEEQEIGVKNISTAMQQINRTTQHNSGAAENASGAVARISSDTDRLRTLIEELRALIQGAEEVEERSYMYSPEVPIYSGKEGKAGGNISHSFNQGHGRRGSKNGYGEMTSRI